MGSLASCGVGLRPWAAALSWLSTPRSCEIAEGPVVVLLQSFLMILGEKSHKVHNQDHLLRGAEEDDFW